MLRLAVLLTLMLAPVLKAEEQKADLPSFGRRLMAALRVPESATNVSELVPSDDQLAELAKWEGFSGPKELRVLGHEVDSRFGLHNKFVENLSADLKQMRRMLSPLDVDVTVDPEFSFATIDRSEYLLLRFRNYEVVLAPSKVELNGRIFIARVGVSAVVKSRERSITLAVWRSICNQFYEGAEWPYHWYPCEFIAEFTGTDPAVRETGEALCFAFLKHFDQFGRIDLAKDAEPAVESDHAMPLPLRSVFTIQWLEKALKGVEGQWKLANFTCRRIDEDFLKRIIDEKRDRESWVGALQLKEDDVAAISKLLAVPQKNFENPDALSLLINGAKEEGDYLRGVIAARQKDTKWSRLADKARASVDFGSTTRVLQIDCSYENGEWRLTNIAFKFKQ